MKKLKVLKAFFDRKEDKYIYPDKEPTIEREESRAEELIKAQVCEELDAESADDAQTETPVENTSEGDAPEEKPASEEPEKKEPAKKTKGKSKATK